VKLILFAAALSLGAPALAQSGKTVSDPSLSMGPRGVTQQGTVPMGSACTPAGFNSGTSAYPTCVSGPGWTGSRAKPCSKSFTDHCLQAYERPVCPNKFNPDCPK
jgi:hypothetical protein